MASYLKVISVIYLIIIKELIACHEECGRNARGQFEEDANGVWIGCFCTCLSGFTPTDQQRVEIGGRVTCIRL